MTFSTVQLGKSGIKVPRLMIGAETLGGHDWGDFDVAEVERASDYAIETGLNFFDVADCYGLGSAEERLGRLARHKRHQVVIATKFGVRFGSGKTYYDNSPNYMQQALEDSLRRLGTDFIDLYQVHWPDGKTPLGAVLEALERHRESGKIRTYGVSNMSLSNVSAAGLPDHLVSFSREFSLANRMHEREIELTCARLPLSFLSWGTLGQGVLSGKYTTKTQFGSNDRRSKPQWTNFQTQTFEKNLQIVESMRSVAQDLEEDTPPLTAIAIGWNLHRVQASIAIAGAKTIQQVDQNARALNLSLPSWAIERLNAASSWTSPLAETG